MALAGSKNSLTMTGYCSSAISALLLLFCSCAIVPIASSKSLKRSQADARLLNEDVSEVLDLVNKRVEQALDLNPDDIPLPMKFQHIYDEVAHQELLAPEPDDFIEGVDANTENVLLVGERFGEHFVRHSFCGGLANRQPSITNNSDSRLQAIIFKPSEPVRGTVTKATLSLPIGWVRHNSKTINALHCIEGQLKIELKIIKISLRGMRKNGQFLERDIFKLNKGFFGEDSLAVILDDRWNKEEIDGTAYLMMDTEYVETRHAITHKCNVSLTFNEQPCCLYPFELKRDSHGLRHVLNDRLVIHRCRGRPMVAGEGDRTRMPLLDDHVRDLTKSGMSRRLLNPVVRTCTESKFGKSHLVVQQPNGRKHIQVLDNLDATECVVLY